jgi:hypothetical protein
MRKDKYLFPEKNIIVDALFLLTEAILHDDIQTLKNKINSYKSILGEPNE